MTTKLFIITCLSLASAVSVNSVNAETLAEMLRRMDRELQEVRALASENNIALATVPKGAVVPFRLVECPSGWKALSRAAGRTIIGIGEGESLTERALGERGGKENHELTQEELPRIELSTAGDDITHTSDEMRTGIGINRTATADNPIEFVAPGKPHSNMQPWIALLYCEKQ